MRKKIFYSLAIVSSVIFWFSLPKPLFKVPYSYVIEDNKGDLMGAMVASDGQWRFPEKDKVPDKFAQCLIAFEDKRFYYHPGIDPIAIGRAFSNNLKSSRVVSGASTINMQVIRLARKQDRTIFQKIVEAILALRLQLTHSKKEVLALYAAHAPFGGNVVGLEAASWRYYGREPEDLTWAESATLAVLPNAPSLIHPGKNRTHLLEKRNRLLDKLYENETIDEATLLSAREEPLPEKPHPLPTLAPHLLQWYKKQTNKGIYTGTAARLSSTLDMTIQQNVQNILYRHHLDLKQNSINNACALVLDVRNGTVLSYVGNVYDTHNKDNAMHVDIIRSRRSPGSLLKPILYAAMMTDGLILPNALIPDIPTQMSGYVPQNFDLKYDGAVRASQVVSRSLNIPSVRMLRSYNYIRFHHLMTVLGITTFDKPPAHYGLSMILGGGEITMWEIAGLYGHLAQQYNQMNYSRQKDTEYTSLDWTFIRTEESQKKSTQAYLDNASLGWMFASMEDVMRPGEEVFWQQFMSSRRISWKTGTSFGFRDAWAIGITPEYVVAVWTGNANGEGRPGLVGVRTAAPILFEIFEKLPPTSWFRQPEQGITQTSVCRESGFKAGPNCTSVQETVPQSTLKSPQCPYHVRIHLDKNGYRVHDQCESPVNMYSKGWFVLPPAIEQYYRQIHFDYKPLPTYRSDCQTNSSYNEMEIVYPPKDARIKVPRELDGQYEAAIFHVAHRRSDATIYWSLNDEFIATTTGNHKLPFRPEPGKYMLTVTDDLGERKQVSFEVR